MKIRSRISTFSSKILAAFLGAYLISWGIILLALYITFSRQEISEHKQLSTEVYRLFDASMEHNAHIFSSLLQLMADRPDIRNIIKNRDREAALELLGSRFEQLRSQLDITHLYISDSQHRNIVRIHGPEHFGDLNKRHATFFSDGSRSPKTTASMGKQGSISHRVMVPVYEGDEFLGVLELAEEIYKSWHAITERYNAAAYFLTSKRFLLKEYWILGKATFGWPGNWDDHPQYAIVGHSGKGPALDSHTAFELLEAGVSEPLALKKLGSDNLNYTILPLSLSPDKPIGYIVFAYPSGVITDELQRTILRALLASAAAMLVGVFLCYLILRPYARALELRRNQLEDEVTQKTAKLTAATEAAIRARDEAELASKAKSDFLSNMSHELRTPLNAIIGFSAILQNNELDDIICKRYQDYANDINNSGKHLLSIINDVLDVSRVEAGEMTLHLETLDLEKVLEECHQMVNVRATKHNVAICRPFMSEPITLEADHTRLKQVILNLLINAVKFTLPPGAIQIYARKVDNSHVAITIEDEGLGVAKEDMPIILRRFGKAAAGNTPHTMEEGTGLGLTLVQDLVALHNGKFDFSSAKGVGTKVTVTLPLRQPDNDNSSQHAI